MKAKRAAPSLKQHPQSLGDLIGLSFETARSNADRIDSGQFQVLDSQRIPLECGTGPVSLVSVEFNREALLLPVRIDLVPGDKQVDGRPR